MTVAFPQTPLDVRTEIQIGGAWVDVTADTYTRDPITISRGTADEASSTEPSTCSLTLNNRSGKYSPRNPLSPYYGLIGRNTPLRVSVPGTESYLALDGTAAGVASTPDVAALDITGDLDIRVEATVDWYATDDHILIGKWDAAAGQRSWKINLVGGVAQLWFSTNGAATFFAGVVLPALPRRAAIRATLDVDNGAGGWTARLYWAPSLDGPWVQFGSELVVPGITSVFASTAPLMIAPTSTTVTPNVTPVRGRYHRAEVRSGIGGTVVASPDFRAKAAGTTGFTDSAGRVWSVTSPAAVTNRQARFVGEISAWPSRWDVSGADVWVPIEAAGILRRMGQGKKGLDSTLRRRIPSGAGMLAYWPMEDEQGATAAYSPLPNVLPLSVSGLDFAAEDSLGGSSPLPKLKNPASLVARVPGTTTTGWQVEFVYNLPTMPAAQTEIVRVAVTGAVLRTVVLYASTAGIRIEMLDKDDALLAFFLNTGPIAMAAFTGGWNRLAIYSGDAGGGQTRIQATWRDVSANIRYYASTFATTGQGRVTTVRGSWGAATEGMAIGHLAVSATPGTGVSGSPPASTIFEGADDGFAGESVINRMARLADEEAAQLDLSWLVGDPSTSSERMGPQRPNTLLDLLGEAAETDGGILYERLDRAALVYRDRASLYNQRVALALDYLAKGEVPPPLEPTEDDQKVRNDVTVTRSGGSSGRVVEQTGPLSVNPPPAGVGPYDESLTLSLYDDTQPERIAGWRVHLGTVDEARYSTISVWLHAAPHLVDTVLGMDIGDRITIAHPPAWLPPNTIDQHAAGYTEVLDQFEWTLTYNCAPASPWQVGVEGDPVYARADTAGSALASSATATATTLSVATTAGPVWVTAAPNEIADPGFEQGTGTWACTRGASIGVVSWERNLVHSGTGAARMTRVHPTDTGTMNMNDSVSGLKPAAAGQVWAGSAWVLSGGAAANAMRAAVIWRDGAGVETNISGTGVSIRAGDGWAQVSVTATAPAGTASVRLLIEGRSAWTVGEWWVADDVRLARTDTLVGTDMAAEFPFPVTVGGEVVNVHGISGTTSPQTFYVNRSQNGIVKAQASGTDLRLTYPTIAAL